MFLYRPLRRQKGPYLAHHFLEVCWGNWTFEMF